MFHPIVGLLWKGSCSLLCLLGISAAVLNWASWCVFGVSPCLLLRASPELLGASFPGSFGEALGFNSVPEISACAGFNLQQAGNCKSEMSQAGPSSGQPMEELPPQLQEQMDRLVRQRLEQALGSVIGRVLTATERAAQATEAQAAASKSDGMIKALKVDIWKPVSREEELRTWREWYFQLCTWLIAHDGDYENELNAINVDTPIDHIDLDSETIVRSQKLYGVLCSVLKNRPLLLIRGLEKERGGYEALRILKKEMEPRERARSLAIVKQLASWQFKDNVGLHEQLIAYEEALRSYEASSGNKFPEDLMVATVVTGLKEPLRSQVQLRMTSSTQYNDIREWILQYENVNAPWSMSVNAKGNYLQGNGGGPQPMEVDQVYAWSGKQGKDKGKGKYQKGPKGKDKGGKKGGYKGGGHWKQHQPQQTRDPQSGKGKGVNSWSNGWQNSQYVANQQKGPKGKPKGSRGSTSDVCHLCGQPGHWKNECPKGKGKGVRQVEETASRAPPSSESTVSTSASAYRTPSVVQRVQKVEATALSTPPGCRVTRIFDISEVDSDIENFTLDARPSEYGVMVVEALPCSSCFAMDASDGDGDWTVWEPSECDQNLLGEAPSKVLGINMVKASLHSLQEVEVVLDSGADVSVAPLAFAKCGEPSGISGVVMQDAQGKRIPELGSRVLSVEVQDVHGHPVRIKEKFAIANVGSLILSLGRLLRGGWNLSHGTDGQVMTKSGCSVPIKLRRNTLVVAAVVSAIALLDAGPLPPHAEEVAAHPGWHILPSGLPLLIAHRCDELPLESSVWSSEDWTWVAVFVRKEPSTRLPEEGDVWLQVLTLSTEEFEQSPKKICELEAELEGYHDIALLFHVEELPKDLLSSPRDIFSEPHEDEPPILPMGWENAPESADVEDVVAEGREVRGHERHREDGEAEIDGIKLSVETPLRILKSVCERLNLPKSGGKNKVLNRLKNHYEVLQKQLASDVAKRLYQEQERHPDTIKAPVLPSPLQQELHAVTHQPFQPWCQACVLGRSRQSPHEKRDDEKDDQLQQDEKRPIIQIDYCYTFTRERAEAEDGDPEDQRQQEEGESAGHEAQPQEDRPDCRDQFGLNLVAAESTSGWVTSVPILAKGATSLKKVTEALVRLSMQVGGGGDVIVQGDPESAVKQVLNSVAACRTRLGLRTIIRHAPRGSHSSNGQAEKAVSTIRRNALTLRAHLEDRIKGKIGGQCPIFAWAMRHAAFLHNRFFVGVRGAPAYEILNGRKYRGKLLPFGELCIFHKPSRHKGDLQWRRGVWVGVNERNGAHILLTEDGACESRSIRRLPAEDQWSCKEVLGARGLPWDYGGKQVRKRPLYTSARVPLLPDSATLEDIAKAAGRAAADAIASSTPKPPEPDEAGTDPSSSSSSSPSSSSPSAAGELAPAGESKAGGLARAGEAKAGELAPAISAQSSGSAMSSTEMDTSNKSSRPAPAQETVSPKKLRLNLSRPSTSGPAETESPSKSRLYPPGFAGVNEVHGDVPLDEASCYSDWIEDVSHALENDLVNYEVLDFDGDSPPSLSPEELSELDLESDKVEVERLVGMGVLRAVKPEEDISKFEFLTTKVVHDWRKRPSWVRRSRLVAREFRTWSPWSQELFAPASSLAVVHGLMAYAQAKGLEIVTLDVKDAYLNVPQRNPVIIEVDGRLFGEPEKGQIPYILERLLPGQRIAASEWFQYMKDLLSEAGMTGFTKEPTLFKDTANGTGSSMVLHADDGLLASTPEARVTLVKKLSEKVKIQVSEPLREPGDEIEFLKRKYVLSQGGIVMFSGRKHLEGLLDTLGPNLKERDSPADPTFLEVDTSPELAAGKSKVYKECVGRLLYLSHTRPDIQFGVCILASKMSKPTSMSMKWLQRVVGYLKKVPNLGFLIKPVRDKACIDYGGHDHFNEGSKMVLESVTDADWAGCKKTRRSRSSIQLYLGGSLLASLVRTQRSVALSSGESEFIAMVGGGTEAVYLKECLEFLVGESSSIDAVLRSDSAACRGISQRIGCGRIRHLDCGLLWLQDAVRRKIMRPAAISGQKNPADIGTKPLAGPRLRELLCRAGAISEDGEKYGEAEMDDAEQRANVRQLMKSGSFSSSNAKKLLPVLLILAQVFTAEGYEGLGMVTGLSMVEDAVLSFATEISSMAIIVFASVCIIGLPWIAICWLRRVLQQMSPTERESRTPQTRTTATQTSIATSSTSIQADLGASANERRFMHEYVDRATFLTEAVQEEHAVVRRSQEALRQIRAENRQLAQELQQERARPRVPQEVAVATSRGRSFHVPTCPHLRSSGSVRSFAPCQDCFRNA